MRAEEKYRPSCRYRYKYEDRCRHRDIKIDIDRDVKLDLDVDIGVDIDIDAGLDVEILGIWAIHRDPGAANHYSHPGVDRIWS